MSKSMQAAAVAAVFVGLASLAHALQQSEEEKAVRAVVENYLKGVEKQDVPTLERAFDTPNAHIKFVRRGQDGKESLQVAPIAEAFGWWTKPPARPCVGRVLAIDILEGKLAMVKYEFRWGERLFLDYLSLYRINGEWKIVNKVFVDVTPKPA